MKHWVPKLLFLLAVCFIGFTVNADLIKGMYFSTNIGIGSTSSFDYLGASTDQGSVCDPIINPSADSRQVAGCPTEGTGWLTKFDSGSGIASTFILGRNLDGSGFRKNLSIELEYSYRESSLDQTSSIRSRSGVTRDKLSNEIYRAEEHIGKITSQTVFANFKYRFRSHGKTQPYLGAGFGLVKTSIYGGRIWVRNNDWTQITTGSTLPNSEEVRRNLAATTSVVHEILNDSSPTFQLFAGVNFQMNDTTLIGARGYFTHLESFEATGSLDILRSHEVPAGYSSKREFEALRFTGFGLNLTFLL